MFSQKLTPREFIRKAIDEKLPRHVEGFIERLLAKAYGLRPVKVELPDLELDVALQGFKRLELVGEVKWRKGIKASEIHRIEEKLSRFKCKRVLVVPNERVLERKPDGIEVLTPWELLEIAEESLETSLT